MADRLGHSTYASVKGLVLVGGKSSRMGTDKSELNYHGKPQKEFAKELLESQGIETFYSVAEDQGNAEEIPDSFPNLGPFGGICSAFQKDSNVAWFVLAIDLPFVNESLIKLLLKKRNPMKVATTVKGKSKSFPEPLLTIYEPKAYLLFLQYLTEGNASPRKLLMSSDVEIVEVENELIRNVNTREEFEAVKKELA